MYNEIGSIVSIVSDGIEVARYIYDSYGNHQIYEVNQNGELIINNDLSFIGNINPIRYKSYYYDIESNLYYLNSRYYDSSIGRFISPDDISYLDSNIINGINLWCYCGNNPVMYSDPEGASFILALMVTLIVAETACDIYKIINKNVYVDSNESNEKNVQIENSYLIHTPLVRYGYSIYLNYINEDTKDVINGSSFGVEFEWFCHNIAYYLTRKDRFKSADIGHTIFDDYENRKKSDSTEDRVLSIGMIILYFLCNPMAFFEYSKNRRFNPWIILTKE